jgi:molybdopterin molybdotransferase
MTTPQRLPPSLTPLNAALAMLLDGLEPVVPSQVALAEARGCIASDNPPLRSLPLRDIAAVDGWAFCARDLVGVSSYSPLPLRQPPVWVEAGDAMPPGCDCVVDSDSVEMSGALAQAVAEAAPGQGIRRAGDDIPQAGALISPGQPIRALDLLLARAAGLPALVVRRPRLHLVNVPAAVGNIDVTAHLIAEQAQAVGAAVTRSDATERDAVAIAKAFTVHPCDLVISIGGTGVGRRDSTTEALALQGMLLAHGIALAPGRTTAVGKISGAPVIALPGAPDQAMAAWWTLALPVLDRLAARLPRPKITLPLARKIASGIGLTEVALLKKLDQTWMPLASGELSLATLAEADAWFAVPAGSEGYAADTAVDAYMLRD